jgi:hypothetical protein
MSFLLHHCDRHEKRTTRLLERGAMRANAAEKNLGDRTPEGAVQS